MPDSVFFNLVNLLFCCIKLVSAFSDRLIYNFEIAAARKFLVFDDSEIGFDSVVSQSISKPIVPSGAITEAWRCDNRIFHLFAKRLSILREQN